MDCRLARRYFLELSSPATGEASAAVRAAQDHLLHCTTCSAAVEREQAFDAALSQQLRDVSIPVGLKQRLLEGAVIRSPDAFLRPISRRSVRRWRGGMLAMVLLTCAITAPWIFWTLHAPLVELPALLDLIQQSDRIDDWPPARASIQPAAWSAVQNLRAEPPRQVPGFRAPITVIKFEFLPQPHARPVQGVLWAIEARRLAQSNLLPGLNSAAQYGPSRSPVVWRENEHVFILDVANHPDGLQQMLLALFRSRALV